jgi:hypothetical protein
VDSISAGRAKMFSVESISIKLIGSFLIMINRFCLLSLKERDKKDIELQTFTGGIIYYMIEVLF